MAKSLNDILKSYSDVISGKKSSTTTALTTGNNPGVDYADKMQDTRNFIAQHSVEKFDDRVGNGPDVYQAANVKKAEMKRHGHEPKPKDIRVYNKTNQVNTEEVELDEADLMHIKVGEKVRLTNPKAPARHTVTKIRGQKVHIIDFYSGKEKVLPLNRIKRVKAQAAKLQEAEELNEADLMHIKVGEKVRLTNPKATPRHTVTKIKGDKAHIIDFYSGKEKVFPLNRIKRVKAQAAKLQEAKDEREYGYEGDMAITQLKTICRNAEHLMKMMKPDTDLPEWVQSKITKAEDYISTAHDYLMSEMNEEVETLDEAKCNMSEAGTVCEVHGKKACPKEDSESAQNKETRFTGKKKEGLQLITDRKKDLQEKLTKKTPLKKIISDFENSEDSRFKGDSKEKRKERALAAWYKMHPEEFNRVEESFLDQRSKKSTRSEEASKKMASEISKEKEKEKDVKIKRKEKLFDSDLRKQEMVFSHKLKNKNVKTEQAAPAETVIRMPSGEVGDTGRV
jgi:hypothetical protein